VKIRVVGDRAHRFAESRVEQETEHRRHDGDCESQALQLLRPDAQLAEAPVAHQRQVIAFHVVAETEPHHILKHEIECDRRNRDGERACAAQSAQRDFLSSGADQSRDDKCDRQRRNNRNSEDRIRPPGRECPDGRVRRDGEVRIAQHREDRREADGRDRNQRPGHHTIDQRLQQDRHARSVRL